MRIAQDAIPGALIPMWFKPIKTGTYEVICGQLCGLGHYSMKGSLVVDTPADYQAWLKERAELAAPPPAAPKTGEPRCGNWEQAGCAISGPNGTVRVGLLQRSIVIRRDEDPPRLFGRE